MKKIITQVVVILVTILTSLAHEHIGGNTPPPIKNGGGPFLPY